jgi:hypothetical protein
LALASGQTVRDAAQLAGIGERTATRRVADPDFRRRVAELRGEMVARAMGRLADASVTAVETLRSLLAAEGESPRLGAAKAILELGTKLRENVELEQRLVTLEKAFAKGRS